jgi:hypothetical protein
MNHVHAATKPREQQVRKVVIHLAAAVLEVQEAIASDVDGDPEYLGCLSDAWKLLRETHDLYSAQFPRPVEPRTPKQRNSLWRKTS